MPKLRWRPKKRSTLKFSPVFDQKKVFTHSFNTQTFCPSSCQNFAYYSMLIILSWRPKGGGHGPMPPLNTPLNTNYYWKESRLRLHKIDILSAKWYLTFLHLNLLSWRHFAISTDCLLKVVAGSAGKMISFSLKPKLHGCEPHYMVLHGGNRPRDIRWSSIFFPLQLPISFWQLQGTFFCGWRNFVCGCRTLFWIKLSSNHNSS